jgi:hypothetical protein
MNLNAGTQVFALDTPQRLVERVADDDPIFAKLLDQIVRVEIASVPASVASRVECHSVGAEVTERSNCGGHAKITGHLLIGCSSSEIMR